MTVLIDATLSGIDPTQAEDLRRRLMTLFNRSLAQWKQAMRRAVLTEDDLRLLQRYVGPDERRVRLEQLALAAAVLAFSRVLPRQIETIINRAYGRGRLRAERELKTVLKGFKLPEMPTNTVYAGLARSELEQSVRVAASEVALAGATSSAESPTKLWLALLPVFLTIGRRRLKTLAVTTISRAVNAGKLDVYATSGAVKQVGVVPEKHPPSREITRIPGFPRRTGRGPRYTILTAGDDKVCAVCEDLAGRPYTLEQAHSLLPVHPNCRCVVVPLFED